MHAKIPETFDFDAKYSISGILRAKVPGAGIPENAPRCKTPQSRDAREREREKEKLPDPTSNSKLCYPGPK
jgi:hypothetical protein